jgi:hypothetical protein
MLGQLSLKCQALARMKTVFFHAFIYCALCFIGHVAPIGLFPAATKVCSYADAEVAVAKFGFASGK